MAIEKTITSANAQFVIIVPGLYDVPIPLQGYKADAAWATEDVAPSEVIMGVDGHMSAGYTPYLTPQAVSLMPDSPSADIFENILLAQNATKDIFFMQGTLVIPSIKKVYTVIRGVLTRIKPIPDGKKVLEGRDFQITWENVQPAAFGI